MNGWLRYLAFWDAVQDVMSSSESTGLVKTWNDGSDLNRIAIVIFIGLVPVGFLVFGAVALVDWAFSA
jgi:hypothetical protein